MQVIGCAHIQYIYPCSLQHTIQAGKKRHALRQVICYTNIGVANGDKLGVGITNDMFCVATAYIAVAYNRKSDLVQRLVVLGLKISRIPIAGTAGLLTITFALLVLYHLLDHSDQPIYIVFIVVDMRGYP